MRVQFPSETRCVVALSYDLEMCAGYSPDLVNHGRIMPDLQQYTLALCDIAESFDVKLHFFYVANGLENNSSEFLKEILHRGHVIDSHTYSHVSLATNDLQLLDNELKKANELLEKKLGVKSVVLRGPGGIINGLQGLSANQEVILKNGFHYVSSAYCDPLTETEFQYVEDEQESPLSTAQLSRAVQLTSFDRPYRYESGLIELPIHGLTDRSWFDIHYCTKASELNHWRKLYGHQSVPDNWQAPWTDEGAMEEWLQYNLQLFDKAYEQQALWIPVWHPYSHYLHDRQNEMLKSLLQLAASKPQKVWICTLRDVMPLLE